jgi:hypothetical protein
MRKLFPSFADDQPKYKDLARLKHLLEQADPVIGF